MEPGTSTDGPHLPYIDLKTAIGQGLHPKRLYIETEAFDIERLQPGLDHRRVIMLAWARRQSEAPPKARTAGAVNRLRGLGRLIERKDTVCMVGRRQ